MKKIMFNDRYGLTNAVIGMRKTQTRRVEPDTPFENVAEHADSLEYEDGYIVAYYDGREVCRHKCNYKVGEVVAVAQRYSELYPPEHTITFRNANGINIKARLDQLDGWRNKMYVLSDLMPYRIRITGVNIVCANHFFVRYDGYTPKPIRNAYNIEIDQKGLVTSVLYSRNYAIEFYPNKGWIMRNGSDQHRMHSIKGEAYIEVIGNIHDNPELLSTNH